MAIMRVDYVNPQILIQCRQQFSIPIEVVQKKVPKITDIEQGLLLPTFKQLDTLAELYNVPRWVFIRDTLPEKYCFEGKIPGFRTLKELDYHASPETDTTVRRLMARVEEMREFMLDIKGDIEHEIAQFAPPPYVHDIEQLAEYVRSWLNPSKQSIPFEEWRLLFEQKNIFVFLTSKYRSWSRIDRTLFRGLSIYHEELPIIVINDSDANKARSFTLFHELGHLIKKESTVDTWDDVNDIQFEEELWCDQFAGAVLMPRSIFSKGATDLASLKKIARSFFVSPYACLVRMRYLRLIDDSLYRVLRQALKNEWDDQQKKIKDAGGISRNNRPKEIANQYGSFARFALQGYRDKEISVTHLMNLLELKNINYIEGVEMCL